jgi:cytochrome oxidase Cu insertion factor (SCO1/SenC/PrrC family)
MTIFRALLGVALLASANVFAAPVGKPAPDFTLQDTNGKTVRLADFKGKHVVLEWVNPGCPFVVKHYVSGNMPALQKEWGAKDVVWLAINSTNPTHRDFMKPVTLADWLKGKNAAANSVLMDADGKVGRAYDARVTPHMYIIDPKGMVVYNGAIDDIRSANPDDVKTAKNFVRAALGDLKGGQAVKVSSTQPYGCTVKY